jgi:hypothetical protein
MWLYNADHYDTSGKTLNDTTFQTLRCRDITIITSKLSFIFSGTNCNMVFLSLSVPGLAEKRPSVLVGKLGSC